MTIQIIFILLHTYVGRLKSNVVSSVTFCLCNASVASDQFVQPISMYPNSQKLNNSDAAKLTFNIYT